MKEGAWAIFEVCFYFEIGIIVLIEGVNGRPIGKCEMFVVKRKGVGMMILQVKSRYPGRESGWVCVYSVFI
jgi:hypothetical protein